MQIWNTSRIREWDHYTITNEPVASIELMERAAKACRDWLYDNGYAEKRFQIYCGKGNNGGDGLALARLLAQQGRQVTVCIMEFGTLGTPDFQENLARLHDTPVQLIFISDPSLLHPVPPEAILIDALIGSGLHKPLDGLAAAIATHINQSANEIISIDMPSGLFAERSSRKHTVVRATHTLSFQCYKLAFLMPENEEFAGKVHILDIGLHPDFEKIHQPDYRFIDGPLVKSIYRDRALFAHKGKQGHAALMAGSTGMMGAAVLAAKACLRAGVGKLTSIIPQTGLEIMQVAVPESLCMLSEEFAEAVLPRLAKFESMGIGPGIGTGTARTTEIQLVLAWFKGKLLLDADALNLLAQHPEWLGLLPPQTILTPHIGEWERLDGKPENDFDRIERARTYARQHRCIVVLKGRFTFVAAPDGQAFFNPTGNNGLAKAGTGDVLTGILTSFLAQGYPPLEAALLGVYFHGLAADLAVADISPEALLASDVIEYLGKIDVESI